jgi:DNA-binding Xre family transcriptional regulator
MRWNLRLAAANRGIWRASDLQRMLAEAGLVISAGKMSGLWSGTPASIKLDDLEIICAVVGCGVEELLIAEPAKAARRAEDPPGGQATASQPAAHLSPAVTPKRRGSRSLPPA